MEKLMIQIQDRSTESKVQSVSMTYQGLSVENAMIAIERTLEGLGAKRLTLMGRPQCNIRPKGFKDAAKPR